MKHAEHSRGAAANAIRQFADKLNTTLEGGACRKDRAGKGQFTTPSEAAETIACLVGLEEAPKPCRILDPGAGAGSLALGLLATALEKGIESALTIDLVEHDPLAIPLLDEAARFARSVATRWGLKVEVNTIQADFLVDAGAMDGRYDVVIMNPPYNKLNQSDPARKAVLRRTGVDCPNNYAAFVSTALDLLAEGGQLVAITPRSFANGQYFTQFRQHLTRRMTFRHVVLFERRDRIFQSSSVLQETVIYRADHRPSERGDLVTVETRVDHVSDPHEIHDVEISVVHSNDDPECFINLPGTPEVMALASRMRSHPQTLSSAGLSVSTGPVVDFRVREHLTTADDDTAVPLIYPVNVKAGGVTWPVAGSKHQGLRRSSATQRMLYPNGYYVLVKRFTSKEEKRRVVASVFRPIGGFSTIAFENHVNVIHHNKRPLPPETAEFVASYLNSEDVDTYFRMFSGNTQVNATDLRRLNIPELPRPLANSAPSDIQGSLFDTGLAS